MSLIDCRVRRQEVEVLVAFWVPYLASLGSSEDDGQRMVVVGGEGCFSVHRFVR